jgi:hypothetical protein
MCELPTDKQSDLLSEAYKKYLSYCAEMEADGFCVVDDDQAHKVLYWFIKDSGLMPANQSLEPTEEGQRTSERPE